MGKTAAVLLADGFETIEALTPVDCLRRGGVEVTTVSLMGVPQVISDQHVMVTADAMVEETDLMAFDMLIIPGGSGAERIGGFKPATDAAAAFMAEGKPIGSICAGPAVLARLGLLEGRKATCYPGLEGAFPEGVYQGSGVFTDQNLVTGSGPGYSVGFGLACLALLTNQATADQVGADMLAR